jgi:hypothetical protein
LVLLRCRCAFSALQQLYDDLFLEVSIGGSNHTRSRSRVPTNNKSRLFVTCFKYLSNSRIDYLSSTDSLLRTELKSRYWMWLRRAACRPDRPCTAMDVTRLAVQLCGSELVLSDWQLYWFVRAWGCTFLWLAQLWLSRRTTSQEILL